MIYIIDCGSTKTPAINSMVKEYYSETEVILLDSIPTKFPEHTKAVIISGAPVLLSQIDAKPVVNKFSFLNTVVFPVLGICFGHQIIGIHFGSSVYLGKPVREPAKIELVKQEELFKNIFENPTFVQDHTEGVTLPEGFIHLAKSFDYPVEAMKHPEKNIYGVQFHPEVSGENGRTLIKNFLTILKN
ncbi:MAG: gamma-glutamyl-gamma-aminobutyrate hydrolase family protein [Bacteroidota bacterium]|nr:gamma-glutamyl-gamma-aminobutyrate hydrolase family protein [Bacteroidota bacterium]